MIGLLWTVTILETLGMGLAGFTKFATPDIWTTNFASWGYPVWFTFAIGAAEMGGAILVLIPRLATYAAVLLAVIMVGALSTVIVHSSDLGVAGPIVHLVLLAIIGTSRRSRRWRPA